MLRPYPKLPIFPSQAARPARLARPVGKKVCPGSRPLPLGSGNPSPPSGRTRKPPPSRPKPKTAPAESTRSRPDC